LACALLSAEEKLTWSACNWTFDVPLLSSFLNSPLMSGIGSILAMDSFVKNKKKAPANRAAVIPKIVNLPLRIRSHQNIRTDNSGIIFKLSALDFKRRSLQTHGPATDGAGDGLE